MRFEMQVVILERGVFTDLGNETFMVDAGRNLGYADLNLEDANCTWM